MPELAAAPAHILVVDDDEATRELLRLLLESEGYTPTTVITVATAQTAVAETRPHLVICDVRMPDAPPFALLDQLTSDPTTAHLPLIVCSAAVRELEQAGERLMRAHLQVLHKPFDIDDLLAAVATQLHGQPEHAPSEA